MHPYGTLVPRSDQQPVSPRQHRREVARIAQEADRALNTLKEWGALNQAGILVQASVDNVATAAAQLVPMNAQRYLSYAVNHELGAMQIMASFLRRVV